MKFILKNKKGYVLDWSCFCSKIMKTYYTEVKELAVKFTSKEDAERQADRLNCEVINYEY